MQRTGVYHEMSSMLCVTEKTLRYGDVLFASGTLCAKAPNHARLLHETRDLTSLHEAGPERYPFFLGVVNGAPSFRAGTGCATRKLKVFATTGAEALAP